MSDLNEIRQLYPDLDKYGYTDAEVVNWMAGYLDKNPQELAIEYGVIDPNQGDFARGISSGVDAMQGGMAVLLDWRVNLWVSTRCVTTAIARTRRTWT